MIKLNSSVCIETSPSKVRAGLADLEAIAIWSNAVLHAKCDEGKTSGVGASRVCKIKGDITIRENWIEWDEGKSYKYEGFGLPFVKSAVNRWSVHSENGKTLLKSEAAIVLKGGIIGQLLEPFMKIMFNRMAPGALKSFKYFVENGKPYKGKLSELPNIAPNC